MARPHPRVRFSTWARYFVLLALNPTQLPTILETDLTVSRKREREVSLEPQTPLTVRALLMLLPRSAPFAHMHTPKDGGCSEA
jgi:hypothetical protein